MRKGLVSDVFHYFSSNKIYQYDIEKALVKFCEKDIIFGKHCYRDLNNKEIETFIDWFLFYYKLKDNKQKPLKFYYLTKYLSFNEEDKENYKNLLKSVYSLWKICKVDLDKGIDLENMYNKKHIYVKEKIGTHNANIGDIIISRVGKIDDHYELLGNINWYWLKTEYNHPVLCELLKYKKVNPKLVRDLMEQFLRTIEKLKNNGIEEINKKLINGDECICEMCHKQGKVGGLKFDLITNEPLLYCKNCASKFINYNN